MSAVRFPHLPSKWIFSVEISGIALRNGRTAPAELLQFTAGTFGKRIIVPVGFHAGDPYIGQTVFKDVSGPAVSRAAAGIDIAVRQDRNVAVAAVAAAADHAVTGISGDRELPRFILVQRPEMILFIEVGIAAFCFIFPELFVAHREKLPVFLRRHAGVQFSAGGNIAGKSKDIHSGFYDSVDDPGYFHIILLRYRCHDDASHPRAVDAADLLQSTFKTAGLAEPVMRLPQAVQGELVFLTAIVLQFQAHLVVQVKWIAHDGERNFMCLEKLQQPPEILMQDRIASGQIKIRQPSVNLAEVEAVIEGILHLFPGHTVRLPAWISGENVAVLAALVAFICDMPLEREILFHIVITLPFGDLYIIGISD